MRQKNSDDGHFPDKPKTMVQILPGNKGCITLPDVPGLKNTTVLEKMCFCGRGCEEGAVIVVEHRKYS
jgi:hypothetical protein